MPFRPCRIKRRSFETAIIYDWICITQARDAKLKFIEIYAACITRFISVCYNISTFRQRKQLRLLFPVIPAVSITREINRGNICIVNIKIQILCTSRAVTETKD